MLRRSQIYYSHSTLTEMVLANTKLSGEIIALKCLASVSVSRQNLRRCYTNRLSTARYERGTLDFSFYYNATELEENVF
jgi:hypothetical protein